MNSSKKLAFLFISIFMIYNGLNAWEGHNEDPHYEWFAGDEVAVKDDGIYADSNKGLIKLNVVEYDRVNNRYKVICNCLQRPELDPAEALSIPYQDASE